MNPFTHTLLCCALLLLTLKELTEACSCALTHPQMKFCNADIVVRARVIGEKTMLSPNVFDSTIRYELKVVKIFKGYERMKDIQYVYTPSESSLCGVKLEKMEYVIGGNIHGDEVFINLCGLVSTWDSLSSFQKESLTQPDLGYLRGCACKIKFCGMGGCESTTQDLECTWNDRQQTMTLEREHACIIWRGSVCRWYPTIADKSIFGGYP